MAEPRPKINLAGNPSRPNLPWGGPLALGRRAAVIKNLDPIVTVNTAVVVHRDLGTLSAMSGRLCNFDKFQRKTSIRLSCSFDRSVSIFFTDDP